MCLNITDPSVYLTMGMGYFLSQFAPNPSGVFAAKNIFLVLSDHRIPD